MSTQRALLTRARTPNLPAGVTKTRRPREYPAAAQRLRLGRGMGYLPLAEPEGCQPRWPGCKKDSGKAVKQGCGGESMWEIHAEPEPERRGTVTAQGRGDGAWPSVATSACKPNISVLLQVSEQSPDQHRCPCEGWSRSGRKILQHLPVMDPKSQGPRGQGEGEGCLSQLREEQRWELSLTSRPGNK